MLYINNKLVKGISFAYDGCHKIYICESDEDVKESKEMGYDVYPIEEIEEYYNNSCGLRFISNWQLDTRYIEQFDDNPSFNWVYEKSE